MRVLPAIALCVIGLAVYANSFQGAFVYDDQFAIVENPNIQQLWPLSKALTAPDEAPVAGRPLVCLSLAVNYAIGGFDVTGYHLFNIVVHLLCGLTLYGVIRRTLRTEKLLPTFGDAHEGIAFVAALIWLVHPVQTECVTYITQRTESMMALFYLLTLYCVIRAHESTRSMKWQIGAVSACVLGMCCKETMVTAPFMVFVFDAVFLSGSLRKVFANRKLMYLGLAGTWIVLGWLMIGGPRSESVGFGTQTSAWDYALNQCIMVVKYLGLAFWPHPLIVDYGYTETISIGTALPYALILLPGLAFVIIAFFVRPAMIFPLLWFFVILSPTSSFVPIGTEVGADKRMYLPLAGIIVFVIVLVYAQIKKRNVAIRLKPVAAVVAVVTGLLIWGTVARNADYGSPVALWRTVVEVMPENYRAQNNLGISLLEEGKAKDAGAYFRKAIDLKPDFARAHFNLGLVLIEEEKLDDAIACFKAAVKHDPTLAEAHCNLGLGLMRMKQGNEAVYHFQEALRLKPGYARAEFSLAKALASMGKKEEAASRFMKVIQTDPGFVDAYFNLGVLRLQEGKVDDALELLEKGVRVDPESFGAQYNLGIALWLEKKNATAAVPHLEAALRLEPDHGRAHLYLGEALESLGKLDSALEHYDEASKRMPKTRELRQRIQRLRQQIE